MNLEKINTEILTEINTEINAEIIDITEEKTDNKAIVTTNDNFVVPAIILNPLEIFEDGGTLPLVDQIKARIKEFVPDTSTGKGRTAIRKFATLVGASGSFIDDMGKELKAEHLAIINPIDKERKTWRETIKKLKAEAREPLTIWETEKKFQDDWKKAIIDNKEFDQLLIKKIELDHEAAINDNEFFDRQKELNRIEAEQTKARLKLEQEQRDERVRAQSVKDEEKRRVDAVVKARVDAENVKNEALRKQKAEFDKKERERLAKIKADNDEIARLKKIADDKAADIEHQKFVNNKVLNKFIGLGFSVEDSKKIIESILKNPINEITINY
jgi:hypothetical protein